LAFTITSLGTSATVVGTNSSDSVAAAQLANFTSLTLTAFDADDVVLTSNSNLSAGATISMGQGDDQVTTAAFTAGAAGGLVDLGEGSDTYANNGGAGNLTNVSIKGMGGLDIITLGRAGAGNGLNHNNIFVNGNEGADRITIGLGAGDIFNNSTIVGGSEDDLITINTSIAITGGRVNGQNGDDTITVTQMGAAATATIYGGQGNDTLTYANVAGTNVVRFSGDLGNDTIDGNNQAVNIAGDRLFGGGGNDSINGESGADTLSGGDGVDTFVFGSNTANTGGAFTTAGAALAAGDTILLGAAAGFNNAITNITDFAAGDVLNTTLGTRAISGIGATVNAGTNIGANTSSYFISGSYNAANSTFTVTADNLGTDTLIQLLGGTAGGFVLLSGTNASALTAGSFI